MTSRAGLPFRLRQGSVLEQSLAEELQAREAELVGRERWLVLGQRRRLAARPPRAREERSGLSQEPAGRARSHHVFLGGIGSAVQGLAAAARKQNHGFPLRSGPSAPSGPSAATSSRTATPPVGPPAASPATATLSRRFRAASSWTATLEIRFSEGFCRTGAPEITGSAAESASSAPKIPFREGHFESGAFEVGSARAYFQSGAPRGGFGGLHF